VVTPAFGPHSSSARSLNASVIMMLMLILLSHVFNTEANNNTKSQTSSDFRCTGALFHLVDIHSLSSSKNEERFVYHSLQGFSTQLQV
jgi:hypothetical protein